MAKPLLILALVVLLGGSAYFFFAQNKPTTNAPLQAPTPTQSGQTTSQTTTQVGGFSFENPTKSAHYESNTPAHGVVLPAAPINVVIDFNFDLAKPSAISITKDGVEYGVSETVIDENKLSMRRTVDPLAQDGLYTVSYKACWPDGSCHDGRFQFAIDRTKAAGFEDQTGKREVSISLEDIAFSPKNIKVSKGTRVSFVNNDPTTHYVNTDAHPSHTYYKAQNSKALQNSDTYALTFQTPGVYPYHCSAHAGTMTGTILVE